MQKEEVSEVKFIPFEIYAQEVLSNKQGFVNRKGVIEIVKGSFK